MHELGGDACLGAAPAGAEEAQLSLEVDARDAAGEPAIDAQLAGELAERLRAAARRLGLEQR